jgi:hypothetical protein
MAAVERLIQIQVSGRMSGTAALPPVNAKIPAAAIGKQWYW